MENNEKLPVENIVEKATEKKLTINETKNNESSTKISILDIFAAKRASIEAQKQDEIKKHDENIYRTINSIKEQKTILDNIFQEYDQKDNQISELKKDISPVEETIRKDFIQYKPEFSDTFEITDLDQLFSKIKKNDIKEFQTIPEFQSFYQLNKEIDQLNIEIETLHGQIDIDSLNNRFDLGDVVLAKRKLKFEFPNIPKEVISELQKLFDQKIIELQTQTSAGQAEIEKNKINDLQQRFSKYFQEKIAADLKKNNSFKSTIDKDLANKDSYCSSQIFQDKDVDLIEQKGDQYFIDLLFETENKRYIEQNQIEEKNNLDKNNLDTFDIIYNDVCYNYGFSQKGRYDFEKIKNVSGNVKHHREINKKNHVDLKQLEHHFFSSLFPGEKDPDYSLIESVIDRSLNIYSQTKQKKYKVIKEINFPGEYYPDTQKLGKILHSLCSIHLLTIKQIEEGEYDKIVKDLNLDLKNGTDDLWIKIDNSLLNQLESSDPKTIIDDIKKSQETRNLELKQAQEKIKDTITLLWFKDRINYLKSSKDFREAVHEEHKVKAEQMGFEDLQRQFTTIKIDLLKQIDQNTRIDILPSLWDRSPQDKRRYINAKVKPMTGIEIECDKYGCVSQDVYKDILIKKIKENIARLTLSGLSISTLYDCKYTQDAIHESQQKIDKLQQELEQPIAKFLPIKNKHIFFIKDVLNNKINQYNQEKKILNDIILHQIELSHHLKNPFWILESFYNNNPAAKGVSEDPGMFISEFLDNIKQWLDFQKKQIKPIPRKSQSYLTQFDELVNKYNIAKNQANKLEKS